jgi:hypothetical protein
MSVFLASKYCLQPRIMPTPLPTFTSAVSKAAFVHVTDVVLDSENVTKALKKSGIDDIGDILTLDDIGVESLTYSDPNPKVTKVYPLKRGEIGCLRTFIHYVHYREEINDPIDNKWTSITQDEFNQFCCNIRYKRQFITLSNLQHIPIVTGPSTAPPTTSMTSATSSLSTSPHSASSPVDMFKRGTKHDPFPSAPTPPVSMFTLAEAKDTFTYVLENVVEN